MCIAAGSLDVRVFEDGTDNCQGIASSKADRGKAVAEIMQAQSREPSRCANLTPDALDTLKTPVAG